jgi:hypothetical protein
MSERHVAQMGEINTKHMREREREREREKEKELGKSKYRWEDKTEMNQKHTGRALDVTCSEMSA